MNTTENRVSIFMSHPQTNTYVHLSHFNGTLISKPSANNNLKTLVDTSLNRQ